MKKTISTLLILVSSALFAQDAGQVISVDRKNPPSHIEVCDALGRKVALEFVEGDKSKCKVVLSHFQPEEKYLCSSMSAGEAFSLAQQVSGKGDDQFEIDLRSDSETSSVVKITPLDTKVPLKIVINWQN